MVKSLRKTVKRSGKYEAENMRLWNIIVKWQPQKAWLEKNKVDYKYWREEGEYQEAILMLRHRHLRLNVYQLCDKMTAMTKD